MACANVSGSRRQLGEEVSSSGDLQVGWGQVTFAGSHRVDPACYEFAQTHEGSWVQGGEVMVIPWHREETGSLSEEGLPDPLPQCGVGVHPQGPRRDGRARRDQV